MVQLYSSGIRVFDPTRTIILRTSVPDTSEEGPQEKLIMRLISKSDKYRDWYCNSIIMSFIALLAVLVNILVNINHFYNLPLLWILPHFIIPLMVYLVGLVLLLYSKVLDKRIRKINDKDIKERRMDSKP